MPDNLVLIGFSGTGKSTVARGLARRLGRPLVDVDAEIVRYFGKSIAAVFASDGEARFREVERQIVERVLTGRRQVVSLGGGATVDPVSRALVREGNVVIRLDASPETILGRLRGGTGAEERPMLRNENPLLRITALLDARKDAYAIADVTVNTDGKTPRVVVDEIARWVGSERERR